MALAVEQTATLARRARRPPNFGHVSSPRILYACMCLHVGDYSCVRHARASSRARTPAARVLKHFISMRQYIKQTNQPPLLPRALSAEARAPDRFASNARREFNIDALAEASRCANTVHSLWVPSVTSCVSVSILMKHACSYCTLFWQYSSAESIRRTFVFSVFVNRSESKLRCVIRISDTFEQYHKRTHIWIYCTGGHRLQPHV